MKYEKIREEKVEKIGIIHEVLSAGDNLLKAHELLEDSFQN